MHVPGQGRCPRESPLPRTSPLEVGTMESPGEGAHTATIVWAQERMTGGRQVLETFNGGCVPSLQKDGSFSFFEGGGGVPYLGMGQN